MKRDPKDNLLPPMKPGETRNPNGRPKGIRNRSTIAKSVMSMMVKPPKKIVEQLKELYPEMADRFTAEEVASMVQMMKAMKGDTRAFQVLMDMAYEPHKQKTENVNTNQEVVIDIEEETDKGDS